MIVLEPSSHPAILQAGDPRGSDLVGMPFDTPKASHALASDGLPLTYLEQVRLNPPHGGIGRCPGMKFLRLGCLPNPLALQTRRSE